MRERLIKLRKDRHLTQNQIADAVGIKRATYAGIELGYKNPSLKLAQKIAMFFGVSTDDIFLGEIVPNRNIYGNPIAKKQQHEDADEQSAATDRTA